MRNQQVNTLPPKHFQLFTLGQLALRGSSGEDPELAKRRRKLALLALLALSRRPPARSTLMEMFWGNLSEDRAKHSLSDALSHLRRVLGRDTIAIRSEVVELETAGRLAVDAIEFEAACESRDFAHAIELYGGPFLGGFHVERSQTFDDWVSRARDRYERMFILACESHCLVLLKSGAYAECARIAVRWLEIDTVTAAAAAALLRASLESNDAELGRVALHEYERWNVARVRDLGIGADAKLETIADQITQQLARRRLTPIEAMRAMEATPATPIASIPVVSAEPSITASPPRRLPSTWMWGAAAGVAATLILALVINRRAAAREVPLKPAVALVDFRADASDASLAWLGEGLKQMVAADLARVPLADVIPPSVVREAAERAGQGAPSTPEQRLALARNVHATMAVSATISRNEGSYVVSVTLQNVDDPGPTQTYTATGSNVLVVADQVAAHVLSEVGIGAQGPRLSDVETSNTEAFRHFVQGQHALDDGRPVDANKEFDLAIAADSGFTSAIVARAHGDLDGYVKTKALFDRVRSRLTEWDRRSEATNDAFRDGEHARAEVLAQELEARFPRDPRAIAQLADIYYLHGRFKESERAFLRLLALDSLALMAGHGPCAPCAAVNGLAVARSAMGDTAGARHAALRLTELQPGSPGAWALYGNTLALHGATDQGIVALRRTQALMGDTTFDVFTARALLGARRYEEAQALAQRYLHSSKSRDALDIMATMHRERGEFRAAIPQLVGGSLNLLLGSSYAAIGDSAQARHAIAVGFFDPSRMSAGGARVGAHRGDEARAFAWDHAQLADALWEHADTTVLHALADSVETVGARSYYARDWQLHHHIRGLVALRAGKLGDAEREFSAGMSLFRGWTRTNVMLARVFIAEGHPDRAVETLRAAYLEPLDAMGLYAPRTELDFEMARAYAAMGRPDSARAYSAYVRRAWAKADPEFKRRLAQLP